MRVGIISDFFPLYGAKTIAKLANVLENHGHSAIILTSDSVQTGKKTSAGTQKYLNHSTVIRFKSKYFEPSGSPIAIPPSLSLFANGIFKTYSVDIVHIHFLASFSFQLYSLLSSLCKKYPLVATPHGVVEGYKSPLMRSLGYGIRNLSRVTLGSVDEFTVVSRKSGAFLQRLGIASKRITYIPNGVDLDTFQPMKRAIAEKKMGLESNGKFRILFLAHLRESKGVEIFIEAANRIGKEIEDVEFLIVGSGPLESLVSRKCNESNGLLLHLSYIDDSLLPAAFNSSDLYVLPSYVEGLPQSLLEAMACNTPCIATDVGGVSELFPSVARTALIQPGNPFMLESIIRILLQDENLRNQIRETQFQYAIRNYSLASTGKKQINVYKKHLNKSFSPSLENL